MADDAVPCPLCGAKNRVPRSAPGLPRCGSCETALPWIVEAGETDFDEVTTSSILVLVDLWAPWCSPSVTMAPSVVRAAADLAGRVKVVTVDVSEAPGVAAKLGVRSVPALLLLRDGHVVDRHIGGVPCERLDGWIRQAGVATRG